MNNNEDDLEMDFVFEKLAGRIEPIFIEYTKIDWAYIPVFRYPTLPEYLARRIKEDKEQE